MNCEYIPHIRDAQEANRRALSSSVEGVEVIYAGSWQGYPDVPGEVRQLVVNTAPEGTWLTTCEAYGDGSLNVFVRLNLNQPAIGFVRYRP